MQLSLLVIVALFGIGTISCNSIHRTFSNIKLQADDSEAAKKINEKAANAFSYDVCSTPACIHEASRILSQMDETIEPCDDFFSYACGGFVKETVIPEEKGLITIFSAVSDKLQEQLHSLISEEINPNDSAPFNLAKKLYRSCMNKTLIEERGLQPLRDITDKLGGWPVVKGDQWDMKTEWSWSWAVKELRKIGYSTNYIFDLSNKRIINIDQAGLGLRREYLIKGFEDKVVKAYYEYMVDTAVIYGADRGLAERELKESLEFEMKLANISLPSEERRNYTALYNPHTLRELQQKYPYVQWIEYINALLPPELSVEENEIIVILVPSYFEKLSQLLQDAPKRQIANYMMWRVTADSTVYLTNELRNRKLLYDKVVSGVQEQTARWKECTDITRESLPVAVGALYVRKHFRQESRDIALEMVNGIKKEFEVILNEVEWMDEETRESALKKLGTMYSHIAYPDEFMDDSEIEKYYKKLEIDENNYLSSFLNKNIFGTDYAFSKLRKPVNKTEWVTGRHSYAAVVNAFYEPTENSIQFPAGILQGHFFSPDRPRYLNFGAIGMVIGHEITHGFDDKGSQFDLNGNLVDWWQPETKAHYLEKAKCIIEQYGNFTEPMTGWKLNGINTQGENIADNGGFKESYRAYQKWQKENGHEPKLPGLNYTPQQMFWISAAQSFCSKYRLETLKMKIATDPHSPGPFRVLGPLSNRQEFADDFNCKLGAPMNPVKKCEVW
ncbi:neprilysin-2-like isoform X2 [Contarinia nasturtii]|uniref:neprilysin-2-like isoform X2 n=1 Tax=Contarinia nasturtii TaxID=265458 RepID=UPI0012D413E9|nr:neprilysin-2-like isoform X2 [Contarinia nasturtii]